MSGSVTQVGAAGARSPAHNIPLARLAGRCAGYPGADFGKTVLMLLDTLGISAPAATATKPAIKAYSIRSCACLSLQIFMAMIALVSRLMGYLSFLLFCLPRMQIV
jgi:hypothetical protein